MRTDTSGFREEHCPLSAVWRLLLLLMIILLPAAGCRQSSSLPMPAEKKRELANVLFNQQLYEQAVREYDEYLRYYPLPAKEQAAIAYQIGNIYFDRLSDFENSLAYYLRAKYLDSDAEFQKQVGKKIVECLERLHRSTDAQQVISQTAGLDDSQKESSRPGEVLARIGEREITSGDLSYQISRLPEYLRGQLRDRKARLEFLKQYIAQELLYDSARRKGLDHDKEVLAAVSEAQKSIMVEKLLKDEIDAEGQLDKYTNADVETYYKANQERYAEKDAGGKVKRIPPFSEVAQQAGQDFLQEKKQEIYQALIDRLMQAQQVKIYDE